MERTNLKFVFETRCVEVPAGEVQHLFDMMDASRDISWETFARNTHWQPIARMLGCAVGPEKGLHLKDDRHVGFKRSTWRGKPCYYLDHSRIEHIFVQPEAEFQTH